MAAPRAFIRPLSVSLVALATLPVVSTALMTGEVMLTDKPLCLNLESCSKWLDCLASETSMLFATTEISPSGATTSLPICRY
ncbi:hypothetical protein D3C78_1311900 [compost metagenome]